VLSIPDQTMIHNAYAPRVLLQFRLAYGPTGIWEYIWPFTSGQASWTNRLSELRSYCFRLRVVCNLTVHLTVLLHYRQRNHIVQKIPYLQHFYATVLLYPRENVTLTVASPVLVAVVALVLVKYCKDQIQFTKSRATTSEMTY
jgi:hypothetical protein